MKPILYFAIVLLAVLGIITGYISTQQPRLYIGAERTGFALLKGRYRSYLWSWCDGYTYRVIDKDGRTALAPVIFESSGKGRIGYRWIPKFQHADMANVKLPPGL